jgi:hypothetical protein
MIWKQQQSRQGMEQQKRQKESHMHMVHQERGIRKRPHAQRLPETKSFQIQREVR